MANSPTILYVHGGGWSGGNKTAPDDSAFADELCQLGYRVVTCNYTLACNSAPLPAYNGPSYPDAILDVRAAVGWIRKTGQLAPFFLSNCVVIVGASAGAHLASMVGALNDDATHFIPSGYGLVDLSVRLTIAFSGDYDMHRRGCSNTACIGCPRLAAHPHLPAFGNDNITERFIGYDWQSSPTVVACPSMWTYLTSTQATMTNDPFLDASPAHWIHNKSSPFFMFHSESDRYFPTAEVQWMLDALNAHGITGRAVVEQCGHGLEIYGPVFSAEAVDDVVQNWTGYTHCQ